MLLDSLAIHGLEQITIVLLAGSANNIAKSIMG